MWSLKSWCSLVLKILLFSRMVCYIFQVIWSEVERTSHYMGLMPCLSPYSTGSLVCPLLVSWVAMFSWEAGWGCDVMPGLGALRSMESHLGFYSAFPDIGNLNFRYREIINFPISGNDRHPTEAGHFATLQHHPTTPPINNGPQQ